MILVDRDIKERHKEIFKEGYQENHVNAISYDLEIESIVAREIVRGSYELEPGETIFVKTLEKISMPADLMGRIAEKNSRMRMGLVVSGPHYYPGHETYMYLRVQNISTNRITIKEGDKIAQIIFEQLSGKPDETYDQQQGASFNNEDAYRGLGRYKDEYEKRVTRLNEAQKNLENHETRIYANILTLMGIFVAIFSLITVNFGSISSEGMTKEVLIPMNLSLGIVIALFIGLILIFLNKAKHKWFLVAYIILMIVLIAALCIMF